MSGKSLAWLTAFLEHSVGLKELQKTQRLYLDTKAEPAKQHKRRFCWDTCLYDSLLFLQPGAPILIFLPWKCGKSLQNFIALQGNESMNPCVCRDLKMLSARCDCYS